MRLLLTALLMSCAGLVFADSKIAVVDMERALFLSNAAEESLKKFEKDNKSDVDQIKTIQQELIEMKNKSETDADVMSDDERRKLTSKFEEKSATYQFYAKKLQQAENQWRQAFFQEQQPNIERELKALVEKGKYDIVLQSGAVIFAQPSVDITKQLIDRLNSKK